MTQFGARARQIGALASAEGSNNNGRVRCLPLNESETLFLKRVLFAAAPFFFLATLLSTGFHHPDEHFQILEFVAFKFGYAGADNLTWEYHEKMRPWLQPGVLLLLIKGLQVLGIEQARHWAMACRLLSALLSLAALYAFASVSRRWFRTERMWQLSVWCLFFFWCVPYLGVRPSSENWSAIFFLFGFVVYQNTIRQPLSSQRIRAFVLAGLLWGLAFEFRFQVAILVVATMGHALLIEKKTRILVALPGVLIAIIVGILVDRWGYGVWTLSPWNYLNQNLVAGRVAEFGTSPWWGYFQMVFVKAGPPFSILLLAGTLWAWGRLPKHVLTWITFSFFFVHSCISHKEARFLIPLLGPVLVLVPLSVEAYLERASWVRWAGYVLVPMNALLLCVSLVKPADVRSDLLGHVSAKMGEPVHIYFRGVHPYGPVSQQKFFWFDTLSLHRFEQPAEFDEAAKKSRGVYLFMRGDTFPSDLDPTALGCRIDYASIPAWVRGLDVNGWLDRTPKLTLYECDGNSPGARQN